MFDRNGVDPDNRHAAAAASNPFSGFSRSASAGGRQQGGMYEAEMSPEELFRQFFGGGMGGGFGSPFGMHYCDGVSWIDKTVKHAC